MDTVQLQYPIGRFKAPGHLGEKERTVLIGDLESFPKAMAQLTANLPDALLDTPYRPGGWTVRQVVHHCADANLNCFLRFKLTLTEPTPTIKPYDENLWAASADYSLPVGPSLQLLEGVHQRWVHTLRTMADADWDLQFFHPEQKKR